MTGDTYDEIKKLKEENARMRKATDWIVRGLATNNAWISKLNGEIEGVPFGEFLEDVIDSYQREIKKIIES